MGSASRDIARSQRANNVLWAANAADFDWDTVVEYGRATPAKVRREVRAEDLRAHAALRLIQANARHRADAAQRSLNAQADALKRRTDAEAAWERRRNAARASVPAPAVSAAKGLRI